MREYKIVEKTTRQEKLIAIKCNICEKEITGNFWQLTTHHHDWGNDSIESYRYFDLCSRECINRALDDYIDDCKTSNTECFELEQEFFRKVESE